jgi:hypothetical protein
MPTTPDLITLADYKSLLGIDPTNNQNDSQITALLPAASQAIRSFTGRSFEVSDNTTSDRDYQFDGSGYLDIDDAVDVTAVVTDAGVPGQTYPLDVLEWSAQPFSGPIYYYLLVLGGRWGYSPEMGFERNLDTLGVQPGPPIFTVTAEWGWPEIPEDVQLATAWTVNEIVSGPKSSENLTAEAIEGYSRSWGSRQGTTTLLAIPNRARDLLVAYQRIDV